MIRLPGTRRRRQQELQGLVAEHDLGPFDHGLARLLRDGVEVGHVATTVGYYRTMPGSDPQPWVWLVVRWADGTKEPAVEDYAPWTYVGEMRDGHLVWEGGRHSSRGGRYEVDWVAPEAAPAEWERLDITTADF